MGGKCSVHCLLPNAYCLYFPEDQNEERYIRLASRNGIPPQG
jgi:hypothetical protein